MFTVFSLELFKGSYLALRLAESISRYFSVCLIVCVSVLVSVPLSFQFSKNTVINKMAITNLLQELQDCTEYRRGELSTNFWNTTHGTLEVV